MSLTIPLISRLPVDSKSIWLEQLRQALQSEVINLAENMTLDDLNRAEIAIVASPDLELLNTMKSLKWIQALTAGVEGMIETARKNKYQIARMVDPNLASTMAESVLTWTLFIKNKLPIYLKQQRNKEWNQQTYSAPHQCNVGILGLGEMGKASAATLLKNGFSVYGWSRTKKQIAGVNCYYGKKGLMDFSSLCDVLVCLLPLTKDTKGIINLELLNRLPSGASVINFSRGGTLVDSALIQTLDSKHISHAILDVFDKEPLPRDSELWEHEKITVLPHIAAITDPYTAAKIAAKNIENYLSTGLVTNVVDLDRGY